MLINYAIIWRMKINKNLYSLENPNSFYTATSKIREYKEKHPSNKVLSLGIGDVSFPIAKYVKKKMIEAVKREASKEYVGYGNYYGLYELRKAIRDNEYQDFDIEEIYVSDGTKTDSGSILEMFDKDVSIAIPDPTYPIYINSCLSLSKNYELIDSDDSFVPLIPNKHYDVIYLCSPNNPSGLSYTYEQLERWVKYAIKEKAIIIYDNVYNCFISNGIKSIYEIKDAKRCAIELRSFSKTASFTGIRCSYYVIPNELEKDINKYWRYRTISRFNGASYIAQVGALASFNHKAKKEINKNIQVYKDNALYLLNEFKKLGYEVIGGVDAPYLWIKIKNGLSSWELFDLFLNKLEVVIVPGIIFGNKGDKYFRVSSLGKTKDIKEAMGRIRRYEESL